MRVETEERGREKKREEKELCMEENRLRKYFFNLQP